jgi:hypothetical protein
MVNQFNYGGFEYREMIQKSAKESTNILNQGPIQI